MKAKIRALIVLSILCACLVLVYILLPKGKPVTAGSVSPNAESPAIITDIPVSELLAIAISNSNGAFGILNNPDGITLISDKTGSFSVSQMRATAYTACHLPGIRDLKIIPEAQDIANSLSRFTLILTGGREQNFYILRKSPVGDDYLLFSEEQQSVFLVSAADAEWFLQSAEDFLE